MATKLFSTGIPYSSLPESYVRSESDRPKLSEVSDCENVPVIDLGCPDRDLIVQLIGDACLRYGFFQVINHGVATEVVERMQQVASEFFSLPVEEKMKLYSDYPSNTMRLSTSFNVKKETVHNWRDYLRLHCYPLDKYSPEWPCNPSSFNYVDLKKEDMKDLEAGPDFKNIAVGKKLEELMMGLRQRTVGRQYYTVTGEYPNEEVIEKIISNENGHGGEEFLARAIQEHGRGKLLETVVEIQDRHDPAKEIEKILLELHQVSLDLAVKVEAQGEQMDGIEHHVMNVAQYVKDGSKKLKTAKGYQKRSRRCMCIGIILLLILILVIVIPTATRFSNSYGHF